MRHISGKEFLHYLILFGTQAAIWLPLMDFFGSNLAMTLVAWFIISVIVDQQLHKYFGLG